MHSMETLDKGPIHIQGGMEQDVARFYHTSQKGTQFQTWIISFWNFPFNIFGLWLTETTESQSVDKGGLLYSEKPQSKKQYLDCGISWISLKEDCGEPRAHEQISDDFRSVPASSYTKGRNVFMCPWYKFSFLFCKMVIIIIISASYGCHEN